MSETLVPTITRAGLAACRNAQGTGVLATIGAIGIGPGVLKPAGYVGYLPTGRETRLVTEKVRVPLAEGSPLGGIDGSAPLGFRVLAEVPPLATGTVPYPVNEVGVYLTDGTLLAVWSDPAVILQFMTDRASLDLAFDLYLDQLPTEAMTIQVQRPDVPDTLAILAGLLASNLSLFIGQLRDEWRSPLTPRPGVSP